MKKGKLDRKQEKESGFFQLVSLLPPLLIQKFWIRILGAAVSVIATAFLMVYFRSWQYFPGFILAIFLLYLAMDIVWGHTGGRLIQKRVQILKVSRRLNDQLYVIAKDTELPGGHPESILKFCITVNRKNVKMFTSGTILEIYSDLSTSVSPVAWEIVGIADDASAEN